MKSKNSASLNASIAFALPPRNWQKLSRNKVIEKLLIMEHQEVKVTILVDDVPGGANLPGEHGFSCWVRRGDQCLLFDVGQTSLFLKNVQHLGFDASEIHSLVLSHGHYDHTGGLRSLLGQTGDLKVFVHSDAFRPKYTQDPDGTVRSIGMPITREDVLKRAAIFPMLGPKEILQGIYATGPVPRTLSFEDTGGKFFTDKTCRSLDLLMDDQSLFWESSRGTVILLGCAHSGVINTLNYVRQITCNKPIHAILGGMHLLHASNARLQATLDAFKEYDIKFIGAAHCTGASAVKYFHDNLADRFRVLQTGFSMLFE
jgi:7,8-dihydropterin-6-yl-methyl-4-(beta-D-ribofuranosyl)aminobenzene 5'-phosphate synthase